MKFDVTYRTADGKMAEETVDVSDRNAVYTELRRRGITPISLSESGKGKKKRASQGVAGSFCKVLLVVLLFGAAALAVWYFVLADDGSKRHFVNMVTPSTKVKMRQSPADAPRKGTGAVRVTPASNPANKGE
jgi:type II secretory pathway component PulF